MQGTTTIETPYGTFFAKDIRNYADNRVFDIRTSDEYQARFKINGKEYATSLTAEVYSSRTGEPPRIYLTYGYGGDLTDSASKKLSDALIPALQDAYVPLSRPAAVSQYIRAEAASIASDVAHQVRRAEYGRHGLTLTDEEAKTVKAVIIEAINNELKEM